MLKQMSEKGANTKKGWSSSRSSSGEGPDEVGSVDGLHTENEPFSPSYATPSQQTSMTDKTTSSTLGTNNQYPEQQQQQESFSSVYETSTDKANISTQDQQQYQSNELESSESRKLVAEADDLRSKLRELNIGSFSLDGQDG